MMVRYCFCANGCKVETYDKEQIDKNFLKYKELTKAEYDALETLDSGTLYIISDEPNAYERLDNIDKSIAAINNKLVGVERKVLLSNAEQTIAFDKNDVGVTIYSDTKSLYDRTFEIRTRFHGIFRFRTNSKYKKNGAGDWWRHTHAYVGGINMNMTYKFYVNDDNNTLNAYCNGFSSTEEFVSTDNYIDAIYEIVE